jgi:dTDP-glucose 4,6-dehydratase
MKLLVYGSNGWIGKQVIKYLKLNNINFVNGISRVDNIIDLEKEIIEIKPTHILSLIGRTHGKINDIVYPTIDYLEKEGKLVENIRDNLFSPLILAILLEKFNIHYTYLGTGCIFNYDDEHIFEQEINGFIESSLPNFFGSSYSIVKGYTDRIMHLFPKVLNLRIRMPINDEENERNFITKIVNYKKICSIANSMSVLPELIPIMIDMIKNNITGTINLTNPGLITHNEILTMYKEIVDLNFVWGNFSLIEQNDILLSKRSNNYLDTSLLEKMYPNIKNIKTAIKECLEKYKKSSLIFSNNSNVNLLITGGCGFIGSNFINYIFYKYDKINIINIDALYYCANKNNINKNIRNNNRYTFIEGNLCSKDLLDHILVKYNINYIIHFAAQSHVQNSFEESLQYTKDNILGTHTLLESCRKYNKINKFIHVSTDEVYGESKKNDDHKTEYSTLYPTNPYAGTKAGAELIAQTYYHSFKIPIIITRGNNVYGPNQYPEKLIPKFIKLLKENKKVTIQGDGSSVRGFLYILDTIKAFEIILCDGQIGEIYNIGCDECMEYSVLNVAKILIKLIKNDDDYEKWIEYIEDRPFNDIRYFISNTKLKDLGWNISVNFIDGLKYII